MKLIDAAKQDERIRKLGLWRPWFAWHPVYDRDTGDLVWLEPMERMTEFVTGYDGTYAFTRYRRPAITASAHADSRSAVSDGVNPDKPHG